MRSSRFLVAGLSSLALLTTPPSQARQQPEQDRYQFRVTVDLISLNVTVTDTRNRFVTDLKRDNFSVYEDGIMQEISVFSREDLPLRMILLLDTSASMDEKLGFAQQAAVEFVATLKAEDLAEVVEFGSKAYVLQEFTSDHDKLARAIRMTQAGGTTSLYNALYIALKDLSRRRQDVRRQAIVVLSDGEDTSSLVSFEQVMELAKDTDVTIYTISLREESSERTKLFSEAEHVLKKLAEETGGQWFFPRQIGELDSVYERIAKELKSQYNIGYVSANTRRDGSWRRVVVQTDKPSMLVRTKLGYYAPRANDGDR
ncbi:MAG: VWA domain-containing protein [Acidobacteriota bacterium]